MNWPPPLRSACPPANPNALGQWRNDESSGNSLTGVDFVISKPFLMGDLREAIARVLPRI
jgi:hypothetical protein